MIFYINFVRLGWYSSDCLA